MKKWDCSQMGASDWLQDGGCERFAEFKPWWQSKGCRGHACNQEPQCPGGPGGCPAKLQANQCERACPKGKWQGHLPLGSLYLPACFTSRPPTRPLLCTLPRGDTLFLCLQRHRQLHSLCVLSLTSSSRFTLGRQSVSCYGRAGRHGSRPA